MTNVRTMEALTLQSNLENQIRERAYQLWETSGYQDGVADQHWLTAECEVMASFGASRSAAETPVIKTRKKTTRSHRRSA